MYLSESSIKYVEKRWNFVVLLALWNIRDSKRGSAISSCDSYVFNLDYSDI